MYHDNVVFVLFYTFDSGMMVFFKKLAKNKQTDGTTISFVRDDITLKTLKFTLKFKSYVLYNTSYVTLEHILVLSSTGRL